MSRVLDLATPPPRGEPPAVLDPTGERGTAGLPRRRLSDRIEAAFLEACDCGDFEAATDLLAILERLASRREGTGTRDRRRDAMVIEVLRAELQAARSGPGTMIAGVR